jgi:hypothetical protein
MGRCIGGRCTRTCARDGAARRIRAKTCMPCKSARARRRRHRGRAHAGPTGTLIMRTTSPLAAEWLCPKITLIARSSSGAYLLSRDEGVRLAQSARKVEAKCGPL